MRAGIVYVKIPIASVRYELIKDDVSYLKDSIKMYGLLQPIGVKRLDEGYRLIFGRKRLKACLELGHKYIHSVLLSVREDEEKSVSFSENIHRSCDDFLINALEEYKGSDIKDLLCLNKAQMEYIKALSMLDEDAVKHIDSVSRHFVRISEGDSKYFLRMCEILKNVPLTAKERVRLSVLSDRRIFLNEIQKILDLMRLGGYDDTVFEDGDKIIISKKNAG